MVPITSVPQRKRIARARKSASCSELRRCRGKCKEEKAQNDFTTGEWAHAGSVTSKRGKCKTCVQKYRETKKCSGPCGRELLSTEFCTRQWKQGDKRKLRKRSHCEDPTQRETQCRRCEKHSVDVGPLHLQYQVCENCMKNLQCTTRGCTAATGAVFELGLDQLKRNGCVRCDECHLQWSDRRAS